MNDAAKVRKHLVHDLTCAVCWRLAGVYGSSSRQTGSAALESVSLIKLVMDISDYQSNYDCKNTRKSIRIFVSNIKVKKGLALNLFSIMVMEIVILSCHFFVKLSI